MYRHLGDELLWATSMPCAIARDADIPLAQYGSSHVGRMKTVYRNGLGLRYGRMMQAISGVHFNYSFPLPFWEACAAARGDAPLPGAQFIVGAATSTCCATTAATAGWCCICSAYRPWCASRSCTAARPDSRTSARGTAFEPYATSLRMSDVGYRNRNQAGLEVSVNSLEEYVHDLQRAITTPHPPYEALGVKVNGEYRQLNANILQIENEYYSFIRPKRVARSGERPTKALQARRCRVRRGARARCQRLRSGGREPEQAALPRGVHGAVPDEGVARRSPSPSRACWMRITSSSRAAAASRD